MLLTHASFSEVKCHFVGLKLSDVHRKATRRPEICKSRRVCDRTTECDLQEVAITHLSCLKWLNASCRRVVFTPFFFPLGPGFCTLHVRCTHSLLFTVNSLVRTCRSTRQKHAQSNKNAVNFYLINKILYLYG